MGEYLYVQQCHTAWKMCSEHRHQNTDLMADIRSQQNGNQMLCVKDETASLLLLRTDIIYLILSYAWRKERNLWTLSHD